MLSRKTQNNVNYFTICIYAVTIIIYYFVDNQFFLVLLDTMIKV